jgi:hypothetical protein
MYPQLQISPDRKVFSFRIPIGYVKEIERRLGKKKLLQQAPYRFQPVDGEIGLEVIFIQRSNPHQKYRKLQVGPKLPPFRRYKVIFPRRVITAFESQCSRLFFQGDLLIVSLLPDKPGVQVRFQ